MPSLKPITSASGILAHKIEKNQKRIGMDFSETGIPEQIPTIEWVMIVGKLIP